MPNTPISGLPSGAPAIGSDEIVIARSGANYQLTLSAVLGLVNTGSPGGGSGQIQFNNNGSFGGFTMAGDAILDTGSGTLTVSGTNGVPFAPSATTNALNASNINTGTLNTARMGSGTPNSTNYLRGDGTWAIVSASASLAVGLSPITLGTSGRILYDNAGVLGELATTGSGNVVLATSPTLTTPNLGTPSSLTLTNATGLPVGGISATGTPSSSTWLRGDGSWQTISTSLIVSTTTIASGTNGYILYNNSGVLGNLATTGSGNVVLSTSPTLVTPTLGTPASVTLTNATGLPLTTGVTGLLPVANGGTGTATPSLVNGTNITITGSWPNQTINASSASLTVGTTTISSGTNGYILYNNSGVLGNLATTGSGNVVLATSPTLTTPSLGVASATSINKVTVTAPATGATLTLADGSTLATSGAYSTTFTATGTTTLTLPTSGTVTALGNSTTGSGSIVLATSPTLTTPVLGVATGTSLALNGAPIGTNNLAVTGTSYLNGQVGIGTSTLSTGFVVIGGTQSAAPAMLSITGSNTNAGATVYGISTSAQLIGTTSATTYYGLFNSYALTPPSGTTIGTVYGIYNRINAQGTSTPTNVYSSFADFQLAANATGGTISSFSAYQAGTPGFSASATTNITTAIQYNAATFTQGAAQTITNAYSFYGNQAPTGATNTYCLYMAGSAANYLTNSLTVGGGGTNNVLINGSTTITITAANAVSNGAGTQVTFTFTAAIGTAYPAGSSITTSGFTLAGFTNGTYTVVTSSRTAVTVAATATGSSTASVGGTLNQATPAVIAQGGDANVNLNLVTKGTGTLQLNGVSWQKTNTLLFTVLSYYIASGSTATTIAVTGASGNGFVATLTFSAITTAIPVGSVLTITGMNPSGYNASNVLVTASTTTSVSYVNATTSGFVSGGTIASGTIYTPSTGAVTADVLVVGGGGGGGGGIVSATAASGGAGGGGAGSLARRYRVVDIGANATITLGVGGTAGTVGGAGGLGGLSQFVPSLGTAFNGFGGGGGYFGGIAAATGGGGGGGGVFGAGVTGTAGAGGGGSNGGGAGSFGATPGSVLSGYMLTSAPGTGGGGGTTTASNQGGNNAAQGASGGGSGGATNGSTSGAGGFGFSQAAGVATGVSGISTLLTSYTNQGFGASGGGGATTGAAGAGGNGANGSGGGGGGSSASGTAAAGGKGGDGFIFIVEYF